MPRTISRTSPNWQIPFGKHRGSRIGDVAEDYLEWLVDSSKKTLEQAEAELARRQALEDASQPLALRLVSAGYRQLARDAHPDAGGDPEAFRKLTEARQALESIVKKVLQT